MERLLSQSKLVQTNLSSSASQLKFKSFLELLKSWDVADVISDKASSGINLNWLIEKCQPVASFIAADQMANLIIEACKSAPHELESKLFEILGADEVSLNLLFEHIAPNAGQIAKISVGSEPGTVQINDVNGNEGPSDDELLREYEEAASLAEIAREQIRFIESQKIQKASDKVVLKEARAAIKRAAVLKTKLPFELDDLNSFNFSMGKTPGLGSLAPAGTKQFHEESKLPRGTIRDVQDGFEVVMCPPPVSKYDELSKREVVFLDNVMDGDLRKIFSGVKRLNPMQSRVFDYAFKNRGNMLVCAPTGAGKTNVALLSVAAHLRDENILTERRNRTTRIPSNASKGKKKIVYVAPMKALAAEVTGKFGQKLRPLGLTVREFTGDTQLSKYEAELTDVLVTTPEKWDVVTRKGGVLAESCGLLIIDEVHLLAEERGSVIESIVARLHRHVETSQELCRIVGLSATLPNYEDVAKFLRARCFFFGPEYRPVPLQQTFIGVTEKSKALKEKRMKTVCLKYLNDSLNEGNQVLIFVHSRKATSGTLNDILNIARNPKEIASVDVDSTIMDHFRPDFDHDHYSRFESRVRESRNKEVQNLFQSGMGIHHAGMLRSDRTLSEELFASGIIRILCCTATLAWGVNLPAHTVIICGTSVYNAEKGKMVELGILDVQQIFGRAGRPQFDSSGDAILITDSQENLNHYLNLMVSRVPIESGFIKNLMDHLNAEIVASTVTSLSEAVNWLHYTYFYSRIMKSPISYGISERAVEADPTLDRYLRDLVDGALTRLADSGLCGYDKDSGRISKLDLGRIASYYYVQTEALGVMTDELAIRGDYEDVLDLLCSYTGFENVRVRAEELQEIDLLKERCCPIEIRAPVEEYSGKCCVLIQAYVSQANIKSFTLISDTNFLINSAERITRALLEICLLKKYARLARYCLAWCNAVNRRIWWVKQSLLRHFDVPNHTLAAIETHHQHFFPLITPLEHAHILSEMTTDEVSNVCKLGGSSKKGRLTGQKIINMIHALPILNAVISVHPINQSMIKLNVALTCDFEWNTKYHGGTQSFWLLVEDSENERIYHHDNILINKRSSGSIMHIEITIPVLPPVPSEYFLRILSDSWVGCEKLIRIPLENITFPTYSPIFTSVVDQELLPISSIGEDFSGIYSELSSFNQLQSNIFDSLYGSDSNLLIAAPKGSGKSICKDLVLLRLKKTQAKCRCVYIAPLDSLVEKTYQRWKLLCRSLHWKITKLRGSIDKESIEKSDIIVSTASNWDVYIRKRGSSLKVNLLIMDAIHLIGEERGTLMETIVTRIRYSSNKESVRVVALSETLAGPLDFADWIGADKLYNFPLSSRPVRIDPHIQAFPGRHFIPRMSIMNKAIYSSIKSYARDPGKQVTIFVSSRAQSRSTSLELISHAASDEAMDQDPVSFLNCRGHHLENILQTISDKVLKHSLSFGIGLLHNSLSSTDRETVQKMHSRAEIKILIATYECAWTANYSSVVIIKGTEKYDSTTRRYVDCPLSDVMEMFYLAGRPGSDSTGVAIMMVGEDKKPFYKRRLEEYGLPVESCIFKNLCNVFNVEIAIGEVLNKDDSLNWMMNTFASRRVIQNPTYYSTNPDMAQNFIAKLIDDTLDQLVKHRCIVVNDRGIIASTIFGQTASKFLLDYTIPETIKIALEKMYLKMNDNGMCKNSSENDEMKVTNEMQNILIGHVLFLLSSTSSFTIVPLRFNDEEHIKYLASAMPWGLHDPADKSFDQNETILAMMTSSLKSYLLIQVHIFHKEYPTKDLSSDAASCVRIFKRLLDAMIYVFNKEKTGPSTLFINNILNATKDAIDGN